MRSALPALFALALTLSPFAARADGQKRLAVPEFELVKVKIDRTYFSDLAREVAKKRTPLFVMTRESTEVLLEANGKSMADCVGECEVEVGRKLGADFIISGRITQIGSSLILTARLFATADGSLLGAEEATARSQDELLELAKQAIERLAAPLVALSAANNSLSNLSNPSNMSNTSNSEQKITAPSVDIPLGTSTQAVISFSSDPPGAVVLLDGVLLCQATPCSKLVALGGHNLSLQREGYEPQGAQFSAAEGVNVRLTLPRIFARIAVTTTPPAISLAIDGKPAGATPTQWNELAPGPHELIIDDRCWQRTGERVVLKKGEDRQLQLEAKPRLAGIKLFAEDEQGNALVARALLDKTLVGGVPGSFTLPLCTKSLQLVTTTNGAKTVNLTLQENTVSEEHVLFGPGPTATIVPARPPDPVKGPPQLILRLTEGSPLDAMVITNLQKVNTCSHIEPGRDCVIDHPVLGDTVLHMTNGDADFDVLLTMAAGQTSTATLSTKPGNSFDKWFSGIVIGGGAAVSITAAFLGPDYKSGDSGSTPNGAATALTLGLIATGYGLYYLVEHWAAMHGTFASQVDNIPARQ